MSTETQVLAFDIYGTILDVNAITQKIADCTGIGLEVAAELSQRFRTLQLE